MAFCFLKDVLPRYFTVARFLMFGTFLCIKASPGLQSGKWDTKKLIQDEGKMLKSLIALRKSFAEKKTKKEMGGMQETKFDKSGNVCEVLGAWGPDWAQRLAKVAAVDICANIAPS